MKLCEFLGLFTGIPLDTNVGIDGEYSLVSLTYDAEKRTVSIETFSDDDDDDDDLDDYFTDEDEEDDDDGSSDRS